MAPAFVAAAPWVLRNTAQHADTQGTRVFDYVLYLRAVDFDKLDSYTSEAMNDIHAVVDEAIAKGHLPPGSTFRDRATVIDAYEKVRGVSFTASNAMMGRAARDIMSENRPVIALNTFKYVYWMLLTPDPVYRFQPGGAPGIHGQKNADAELFDIGTYAFGPGSWDTVLEKHRHHLPLTNEPRAATPIMRAAAETFHRYLDAGPGILGWLDSPYELWMLFTGLAGLLTLLTRRREWFVIATVIGIHIGASAFLGASQTRYVLPVRTLLLLYSAFGLCVLFDLIHLAATARKRRTDAFDDYVPQVEATGP